MSKLEVVKYHNELNTAVMERWTAEDFNIFFTVLAKAKEQGTRDIQIEMKEVKELIQHKQSWSKLINIVDRATSRMFMIFYQEKNGVGFNKLTLFDEVKLNEDGTQLSIKMSQKYDYILNRLTKNFTIFELAEYVSLKSTYSKSMFRLLKQWRTIGKKRFKKEDLFLLLDVPKSTQTATNFNKRVLKPITEELSPLFQGLKIIPIKSRQRGNPITHYEFTWKPETSGQWIEGKYDKPAYTAKGRPAKQEIIPEWMQDRPANEPDKQSKPSPEITDKEAEIRARLDRLLNESE